MIRRQQALLMILGVILMSISSWLLVFLIKHVPKIDVLACVFFLIAGIGILSALFLLFYAPWHLKREAVVKRRHRNRGRSARYNRRRDR